jgi:hypothetical protein
VHVIYGTRCYGRSNRRAGLGYVTTRFFHISYLPLVPLQTLFVDERSGRAHALEFQLQPALRVSLRVLMGLLGGSLLLTALMLPLTPRHAPLDPVVLAAFGTLGAAMLAWIWRGHLHEQR